MSNAENILSNEENRRWEEEIWEAVRRVFGSDAMRGVGWSTDRRIFIDEDDLQSFLAALWKRNCGLVLFEGLRICQAVRVCCSLFLVGWGVRVYVRRKK